MPKRWLGLLFLGAWLGAARMAHAELTVDPGTLDFTNVVVGQTPAPTLNATLHATTGTNVTVTVAVASQSGGCSQFQVVTPTGAVNVKPGTDQTVTIRFAPTSRGDKTCTINVVDTDNPDLPALTFTAKGKGIAPIANIAPQSVAFGEADVGQMSASMPVTVANNGDAPLTITSATLIAGASDFVVTGGPTSPVAAGTSGTAWNIRCQPSTRGELTGIFEIVSDSLTNKTVDVMLSCTGNQGSLSNNRPSTNFGAVLRGTMKTVTLTLSNPGNVAVTNISVGLTPAGKGYTVTPSTVASLAAGQNMTFTVAFLPVDRTSGGTQVTLTFTGTWGTARTATATSLFTGEEASYAHSSGPTAIDFGSFRYDARPQMTFRVVNDGNATLPDMTASFVPDNGTKDSEVGVVMRRSSIVQTPTAQIAKDEMLDITVTPQIDRRIGLFSGHVDVTSALIGGLVQVPITGTATAANVQIPATVTFGAVDLNLPAAQQTITIENTGNDNLDIMALRVTGPDGSQSPNSAFTLQLPGTPAHIAPGHTLDIPVVYRPTVATGAQPDMVMLSADLAGALEATATVQITGEAVFSEAHGGGGCDAGGAGKTGGLVLAAAVIAVLTRRRRRGATLAAATCALLTFAPTARAEGVGIAVFDPTPAVTGTGFAVQTPEVGERGSWVASTVMSYASKPLVLDTMTAQGMRTSALVERSGLLQLGGAIALLGRLELGAHMPFYAQSGDAGSTGFQAASGAAIGNLTLHAKARLWRSSGDNVIMVGAAASAMLPTASKDQFTGSGDPEGRLLVLASFTPAALGARLALSVNAGAVLRSKSEFANIVEQSGAAWGLGASVRAIQGVWVTGELFGETMPSAQRTLAANGAMGPATTLSRVEGLAGLTIRPDPRWAIGLAIGRGLTDAVGTPELRGVFSLAYVPGHAAGPGRTVELPRPDGDADGDGIPDSVDKCPNDPEDKDMFEDTDGCPDPDNDHDGIPDEADKCPLDPEDKDGFQDEDGCPDKDNDGDGIPDAIDKCPNEPEDKDGFQDLDGCPDPDNDGDGIPDVADKCPNEPETINGIQDDDGCPDKGDSTIMLSPDRIETLDPIGFTGLKLTRASQPLLGQVAATLRAHSEIVRVRITVHVQPTADAAADQTRSDKRAQAVREWLIQWGIAPARLEARGFGGTKPLVPPDQKGAAKINDRLELIILERK